MVRGEGLGLGVGRGAEVGLVVALGVGDAAGTLLAVTDGAWLDVGDGVAAMPSGARGDHECHGDQCHEERQLTPLRGTEYRIAPVYSTRKPTG